LRPKILSDFASAFLRKRLVAIATKSGAGEVAATLKIKVRRVSGGHFGNQSVVVEVAIALKSKRGG
jgi:hypothetical protein